MHRLSDLVIPAEVLARARAGDDVALEAIYRTCLSGVRTLVRRLVRRPAVADELTHDVFVQILKRLDTFSGSGTFGGWVRSIAVSRCLMHLRSPWNRAALWMERDWSGDEKADAGEPPQTEEPSIRSRQEDERLERALVKLPPLARTVIWLHDVEGFTHAEIAAQLGRSISFSKSQLARAHGRLRELLANSEERVACTPASTSC